VSRAAARTAAEPAAQAGIPGEWSQTVRRLVRWAEPEAEDPLLVLDGMTTAGRGEVLALAQAGWAERGLTVLAGWAPMAPGDTPIAAVYDAVIRSSRWSAVARGDGGGASRDGAGAVAPGDVVPLGDHARHTAGAWADVVRWAAGPRPFVLVLREVGLWSPDALALVEDLAADLASGAPRGCVVVDPVAVAMPDPPRGRVVTCPPSRAPQRVVEADGAQRRIHPALCRALEDVTGDRQVMLEVLRTWRREGRIGLVDGVWMPGGDLQAPPLPLSRPALGVLRALTGRQLAVLAAVAVLGPCRSEDLVAALAGELDGGDRPSVRHCLHDLQQRGLVRLGSAGLDVVDDLVRVSVAASVGVARRHLWTVRAGTGTVRQERGRCGSSATALGDGVSASASARSPGPSEGLIGVPGDGEDVIEAARRALARREAGQLPGTAALAAVVLARRGRLDRARMWYERARDGRGPVAAPSAVTSLGAGREARGRPGAAVTEDALHEVLREWAEAEIRLLEGDRSAAALAFGRARRAAGVVQGRVGGQVAGHEVSVLLHAVSEGVAAAVDGGAPGTPWPAAPDGGWETGASEDYFTAVRRIEAGLQAAEADEASPHLLREVLAAARSRRCVLQWCRGARVARARGLAAGRPPTGPDGVDDVQRALLSLLAAGLSTRDCAAALSMHARAVEYRIRSLFELTGATSRAQLVREYVDGRAIDPSV
jgi:DNA-binding CsgD family transcriptional regulator